MIESKEVTLPFICHFRIASIGEVCDELTHPFTITRNPSLELEGKTKKGVLFHNGTWEAWRDYMLKAIIKTKCKMPKGIMNDSRAMAFLCSLYDNNFLDLLEYNKVAILKPTGIETHGDFKRTEKIKCSNTWLTVWTCEDNKTASKFIGDDDKWIYYGGVEYTEDELLDMGYSYEQIERIKIADIEYDYEFYEQPKFLPTAMQNRNAIKESRESKHIKKLTKKQKKKLKRQMKKRAKKIKQDWKKTDCEFKLEEENIPQWERKLKETNELDDLMPIHKGAVYNGDYYA